MVLFHRPIPILFLFFLLTKISVGNDGLTTEPFYLVMSLFFTVGKEVGPMEGGWGGCEVNATQMV